ncbi:class I SAM-dependent methyltransferase [Kineosporia sp. J2-2]|uniref:Class I SAM-dependent methyltransferase n=1 Tax=Kineosporia corallincola TaxID=2835133 RepID=A0ABS5TNX3_9ACTN|nr:class I SAM-dependent methyltransferase [Kineosporia corallincola]MBT0772801.1 class I SAM-dependent methyltransferase [Kineosporia corallincola]
MSDASGFLRDTADAYDAMVTGYVEMIDGLMDRHPLDRAMLGVLAELVRGAGGGPVADIGCGPGENTDLLSRLGLDAFGIDLSPGMIDHARRTYPGLRFEVGSMLGLDLPDASLAGVLAWYSIIHVPWERRAEVFAEFHRVLAPGGHLLLGFQVGSDSRHRDEAFGRPINLDWRRQQPDEVIALLRQAGFRLWSSTVRESDGQEPTAQGFVLAVRS